MRTIPTAEDFIIKKLDETQPNENRPPTPKEVEEWMIEFAKMHLEEFKKTALKKFDHSTNLIRTLDAYSSDNVV